MGVREKKEKKKKRGFFLLRLSRSFAIVFDWCDIWRRRPISPFSSLLSSFSLSLFLFRFCRWDSICSLNAYSTNCDSTNVNDDEAEKKRQRERDKIIAYTIGTSEAATLRLQNKTSDEKGEEEEEEERRVGKSFFASAIITTQKITLATEWMNR